MKFSIEKFGAMIGWNKNQTESSLNTPRETPTQHQDELLPLPHSENKMRHRPEWVKKSPWLNALSLPMTSKGKTKAVDSTDNGGRVNNSNRAVQSESNNVVKRQVSLSGKADRARFLNAQERVQEIVRPKAQAPKFKDAFFALKSVEEGRTNADDIAHLSLGHDFFLDETGAMKNRAMWENDDRFVSCVGEYTAMADRIVNFVRDKQAQVSPALSDNTLRAIERNFDQFKNQLTDLDNDHYSAHKPTIYGESKALMHTFEQLLSNDRIPMQTRLDAIKNLADKSTVCAGGLHTELSDAVNGLQFTSKGLEGALVRAKSNHIDALILEHVAENHRFRQGDEVHFVNAYFNQFAGDFGLDKRTDPLESIGLKESSEEQRIALGEKIKSDLDPLHLLGNIAEEYLGRVHECLAEAGLDSRQPLSGDELVRANQILNEHQSASWNRMFGDVPMAAYLKPADDMYTTYLVAKSPVAITLHLMDQLKEKEFLDYAPLTLLKEKSTGTEIKMAGSLFWTQNGDVRDAVEIRQLFDKKTETILKAIKSNVPNNQQEMFQKQLVQFAVDHADPAKSDSLPDAWLSEILKATLHSSMKIKTEEQKKWLGSVVACVAACNGEKTLDALIEKKVPLQNVWKKFGKSVSIFKNDREPMMYALENGHLNIASKLCAAGVSLRDSQNLGKPYQYWAASGGHVESLEWLQQQKKELNPRVSINEGDLLGRPMSYLLAHSGNVKALGTLVDVGVNVMDCGLGDDALTAAFSGANLDTLSFLIDRRVVDIHASIAADGRTTAVRAAMFNSDEKQGNIFPYLVEKDPTTFEKVYDYLNLERQDTSKDWIIKNNLRRVVNLLPEEERNAAIEMNNRLQEA